MPPTADIPVPDQLPADIAFVQVFLSTLCWSMLYILCYSVSRHNSFLHECLVRAIILLHGVLIICLTWTALFHPPHPFFRGCEQNSVMHNVVLIISLGFFIYDLVYLVITKSEPPVMVVHHVLGVVAIGGAVLTQRCGAEMMLGMFFLEFTNPLFQLRSILRLTKFKDGIIYIVLEWIFVILFTIIRVFFCGLITLSSIYHPNTNLHLKLTFVTFYILSLVMVFYTLRYVVKKYIKKTKSF